MTENKKPLVTENSSTTETKSTVDKVSEKKLSDKKIDTKKSASPKNAVPSQSNKISKLAILAIIIAIVLPIGHYFWQQQQALQFTSQLSSKFSQESSANFNKLQQVLDIQRSDFSKQLLQVKEQTTNASQEKIAKLHDTVSKLEQRIKQRQPSDWLLHESEYLIRVAARTLWLEHDTKAAMGLLKEADARLAELNDPAFLPVRELIHQDIKSLELLPVLQTDEIVLALMAMNKQVAILPLAIVDLAKDANLEQDIVLSDSINDWQSNLAKTWQKFLDDFIRVRQRTGSVEPLMAPKQQEHLKQNLSLKIQLALWAASERKGKIYRKTLTDIELWLNEYFAMDQDYNQRFMEALLTLQKQRVGYDYPSELASLTAIRTVLNKQMNSLPNSDTAENMVPETTTTEDKITDKVTTEQSKNNEANNEDEL